MYTNGNIPTIATNDFIRRIQKRKYEDTAELFAIEQLLVKKRGYVFRMPRPGSRVVLMASGGIDSTVAWYILMKKFRLHVYPVMVISRRYHPQEAALRHFSLMYQKKFASLHHKPFIIRQSSTPNELTAFDNTLPLSPKAILNSYDQKHKSLNWAPGSGSSMLNAIPIALYLESLKLSTDQPFTTIFCGVTAMDGIGVKSQTLTFIRLSNLYAMQFIANPTIQFASLFFEKQTGWYARKADIIRMGNDAGLPLERTYSCYRAGFIHCGACGGCDARRWEFKTSGIVDKTQYRTSGLGRSYWVEVMRRLTGLFV